MLPYRLQRVFLPPGLAQPAHQGPRREFIVVQKTDNHHHHHHHHHDYDYYLHKLEFSWREERETKKGENVIAGLQKHTQQQSGLIVILVEKGCVKMQFLFWPQEGSTERQKPTWLTGWETHDRNNYRSVVQRVLNIKCQRRACWRRLK